MNPPRKLWEGLPYFKIFFVIYFKNNLENMKAIKKKKKSMTTHLLKIFNKSHSHPLKFSINILNYYQFQISIFNTFIVIYTLT